MQGLADPTLIAGRVYQREREAVQARRKSGLLQPEDLPGSVDTLEPALCYYR
jgi:hypothetical protein